MASLAEIPTSGSPSGHNTAPEQPTARPSRLFSARSRSIGSALELVGACVVGLGFVLQWFALWDLFNHFSPPGSPSYRTFYIVLATSDYLVGSGVVVAGAGWALKRSWLARTNPSFASPSSFKLGVVLSLSLLGAILIAAGVLTLAYPASVTATGGTLQWPLWAEGVGYLPMGAGVALWGIAAFGS